MDNTKMTFSKMNPEVKAEWIAALRSGEYTQGYGKLQDWQGFCCLGVRCELDVEKGLMESVIEDSDDVELPGATRYREAESFGFWETTSISVRTFERWGLDPHAINILIEMNDSDKRTFSEIADWIELNL